MPYPAGWHLTLSTNHVPILVQYSIIRSSNHSRAKRSGLRSLRDRKFSVEDTEWHLLFGRPVSEDLRSKYFDTLQKTLPPASLPN